MTAAGWDALAVVVPLFLLLAAVGLLAFGLVAECVRQERRARDPYAREHRVGKWN